MTTTDEGILNDVHICTSESAYTALTKEDDELYFVPDDSATADDLEDVADRVDDIEDELGDDETAGTIQYKLITASSSDYSSDGSVTTRRVNLKNSNNTTVLTINTVPLRQVFDSTLQSIDEGTTVKYVNDGLATKQATLTAGTGITISNNIISASGSGGGNMTIEKYTATDTFPTDFAEGDIIMVEWGRIPYMNASATDWTTAPTGSSISYATANRPTSVFVLPYDTLSENIHQPLHREWSASLIKDSALMSVYGPNYWNGTSTGNLIMMECMAYNGAGFNGTSVRITLDTLWSYALTVYRITFT